MSPVRHQDQGRPQGRPFFLCIAALTLSACAQHAIRRAPDAEATAARDVACAAAVLPNSRRFAIEAIASGLPAAGQWRDGFDLADMNGDGHLDLLHGPARKGDGRPVIFLGDGAGRFEAWQTAHFPSLPYDYGDAKAADFNGDGRMDIALAAHLRGLTVLVSEGDGHYAPWDTGIGLRAPGQFPGEQSFSSRSLAIADWDQDGQPDLLAVNEGPSRFAGTGPDSEALALFFNRGGYWDRARPQQPLHGFGNALAVGDVDGDGQVDALIGSRMAGSRLLLQIGSRSGFRSSALASLPDHATIDAVALADVDGDHRDEAMVGTLSGSSAGYCAALQVITMPVTAPASSQLLWREHSTDPVSLIQTGDLDGDGNLDLVAIRDKGTIMLFAGSASGFSRDLVFPTPGTLQGCQAFGARLANIDDQPGLELVVGYAGGDDADGLGACPGHGALQVWRLRARR